MPATGIDAVPAAVVPGVKGHGIDVVDIDHFRRSLERTPSMRQRLFTEHELADLAGAIDVVGLKLRTDLGDDVLVNDESLRRWSERLSTIAHRAVDDHRAVRHVVLTCVGEVEALRQRPHPFEFAMYYDI